MKTIVGTFSQPKSLFGGAAEASPGHPRTIVAASLLCIVTGVFASCSGGDGEPGPVGPKTSRGELYLQEVIGVMQANSLHRLTIDWTSFRTQVMADAAGAESIEDVYPAIRTALRLLGDGHSSFRTIQGTVLYEPNRVCTALAFPQPAVPVSLGYVRVRSVSGAAGPATQAYANALQDSIRVNDRAGVTGWIVDLRGNPGGNMWPMLAGIGPILGTGIVGYFIDPTGGETAWSYSNGAALSGHATIERVDNPYHVQQASPRVAVLIDQRVASSGEAIAIAFKSRLDTRFFGTSTCGQSTSNREFTMSDGAILNLTVAVMADRARHTYGDVVDPDETIADRDQVVQRAVEWLLEE